MILPTVCKFLWRKKNNNKELNLHCHYVEKRPPWFQHHWLLKLWVYKNWTLPIRTDLILRNVSSILIHSKFTLVCNRLVSGLSIEEIFGQIFCKIRRVERSIIRWLITLKFHWLARLSTSYGVWFHHRKRDTSSAIHFYDFFRNDDKSVLVANKIF